MFETAWAEQHALYVWFLPFGHFSCVIFFPFFQSCPSCIAKCKPRLSNIIVFSCLCYQNPKTKHGMNETLLSNLGIYCGASPLILHIAWDVCQTARLQQLWTYVFISFVYICMQYILPPHKNLTQTFFATSILN